MEKILDSEGQEIKNGDLLMFVRSRVPKLGRYSGVSSSIQVDEGEELSQRLEVKLEDGREIGWFNHDVRVVSL